MGELLLTDLDFSQNQVDIHDAKGNIVDEIQQDFADISDPFISQDELDTLADQDELKALADFEHRQNVTQAWVESDELIPNQNGPLPFSETVAEAEDALAEISSNRFRQQADTDPAEAYLQAESLMTHSLMLALTSVGNDQEADRLKELQEELKKLGQETWEKYLSSESNLGNHDLVDQRILNPVRAVLAVGMVIGAVSPAVDYFKDRFEDKDQSVPQTPNIVDKGTSNGDILDTQVEQGFAPQSIGQGFNQDNPDPNGPKALRVSSSQNTEVNTLVYEPGRGAVSAPEVSSDQSEDDGEEFDTHVIERDPFQINEHNSQANIRSEATSQSTRQGQLQTNLNFEVIEIQRDGEHAFTNDNSQYKTTWLRIEQELQDGSRVEGWVYLPAAGLSDETITELMAYFDFIPADQQPNGAPRTGHLAGETNPIRPGIGGPFDSEVIVDMVQQESLRLKEDILASDVEVIGQLETTVGYNLETGDKWRHTVFAFTHNEQGRVTDVYVRTNSDGRIADHFSAYVPGESEGFLRIEIPEGLEVGWEYNDDNENVYLVLHKEADDFAYLDVVNGEWVLHPQAPEWLIEQIENDPGLWEQILAGDVNIDDLKPEGLDGIISAAYATDEQRERVNELPPLIIGDRGSDTFVLLSMLLTDVEIVNHDGNPVAVMTFSYNYSGTIRTVTFESPAVYNADNFERPNAISADRFPVGRIVDPAIALLPSSDPNYYLGGCTGVIGPANLDPEFCAQFVAGMANSTVSKSSIQNHNFEATFLYSLIINPRDYSSP